MSPKRNVRSDEYKSVFGNRRKDNGSSSAIADWTTVPGDLVLNLINTVTSRGGAIRFGYTRDGGAYAVGFYYGSESTTEYCRPGEDVEAFLGGWVETYTELPMSGGKSPDQPK